MDEPDNNLDKMFFVRITFESYYITLEVLDLNFFFEKKEYLNQFVDILNTKFPL